MEAKTLVQVWLEVELIQNNKSLADALRALNKKLGTAYRHSRMREWEQIRDGRGSRLPREVRVYMAKIVASTVLESAGINTKKVSSIKLNQIAEMFC